MSVEGSSRPGPHLLGEWCLCLEPSWDLCPAIGLEGFLISEAKQKAWNCKSCLVNAAILVSTEPFIQVRSAHLERNKVCELFCAALLKAVY